MTDDRIDLSPLDLAPDRRAALREAILAHGAPILARHAAARGPVAILAACLGPALAAAAVVTAIALGSLAAMRAEADAVPTASTAAALGFPEPVTAWVEAGRVPSVEELAISMEEVTR